MFCTTVKLLYIHFIYIFWSSLTFYCSPSLSILSLCQISQSAAVMHSNTQVAADVVLHVTASNLTDLKRSCLARVHKHSLLS